MGRKRKSSTEWLRIRSATRRSRRTAVQSFVLADIASQVTIRDRVSNAAQTDLVFSHTWPSAVKHTFHSFARRLKRTKTQVPRKYNDYRGRLHRAHSKILQGLNLPKDQGDRQVLPSSSCKKFSNPVYIWCGALGKQGL